MINSVPLKPLVNSSVKKRIKTDKEIESKRLYLEAQFIHDRFCKFEIPYKPNEEVNIIRDIKKILPNMEAFKTAELPFKLNSLRWFLTPDGKKFLLKQEGRYRLDLKRQALDFDNLPPRPIQDPDLNQIAVPENPAYPKKVKEKGRSVIDFLE